MATTTAGSNLYREGGDGQLREEALVLERRGDVRPADFRGSRRWTHPPQPMPIPKAACPVQISADLDSGAVHLHLYIVAQEAPRGGQDGLP
jgi:hypothetical protein